MEDLTYGEPEVGESRPSGIIWPDERGPASASVCPEPGCQRESSVILDDQIWPPIYLLAGTITITDGSVHARADALTHIRNMLAWNLDDFRVTSHRTEPLAEILSFQTTTAGQHEDWVLEAIAAACRTAGTSASEVVARVVSLRTKRQLTWR